MRRFLVLVSLVLCSCGSANDLAAALKITPAPIINATPVPKKADVFSDYAKISRGMKREEIVATLGEPTTSRFDTFCDNGKCRTYEYLSYLYNEKKIGVTIEGGVATFTYVM